ncbi:MAG TPA: MraY family glycosyltransferase [Bryobacteraceae bacterium]|nr:MraY family glycosyltransferase [Bryobacteraceae bacterium]
MLTLLVLFSSALVVALAVTPVLCKVAVRFGWVDLPDARKVHCAPVPRVGGIAVFLAYVTALGLLAFTPLNARAAADDSFYLAWRLLPAAVIVFVTGLLDDRFGLTPWQKLGGQFAGAVLACLAGVRIYGIAWQAVNPWIGVLLTLLWLIACTNAFNLIDGLDGLAAGIGLFATLTTFVAGLLHGDFGLALATAPLAGALIGFLRYNFNPATVFLGDAGSLFVGFLLGCYSVIWSHKSTTILGMVAPLMALAVPICDTGLAVLRRFLTAKPIFGADRGHIHHRLLDLGLTPRRVVMMLYLASAAAACFALIQSYVPNGLSGLVLLGFSIAAWFCIHRLGYEEFRAAADSLRLRLLRRHVGDQLRLGRFEASLTAAVTQDECWNAVREGAREFGFTSVALQLNGKSYQESICPSGNGQWSVSIPLAGSDYIHLTRDFHSAQSPLTFTPFVDSVYRELVQNRKPRSTQPVHPALRPTFPVSRPGIARRHAPHVRAMSASSGGPPVEDLPQANTVSGGRIRRRFR